MWVKVCGVTTPEDARAAVRAGADALGLNFVPGSARFVTLSEACRVIEAVRGRVHMVGVVADRTEDECREILRVTKVDQLQLHGQEEPELLEALLPRAFKAVGIESKDDVNSVQRFGGTRLLVDAKVRGKSGGAGVAFDWSWVVALARQRQLVVAGGLRADNVAQAIQVIAPFGVDVASGVEVPGDKRRKDEARMRDFIRAASEAQSQLGAP